MSEAHDVLWRMRPAPSAPLPTWRTFRLYSARAYSQVADIDRAHHHEALYFAQYERQLADELKAKIEKDGASNHNA